LTEAAKDVFYWCFGALAWQECIKVHQNLSCWI